MKPITNRKATISIHNTSISQALEVKDYVIKKYWSNIDFPLTILHPNTIETAQYINNNPISILN